MKSFLFSSFIGIGLICAAAHAAPGVSAESIVIGQSAAFSGSAAPLGVAMRDGANLYFDEVNRAGGVHGRKVRLLSLDDGYGPARTVANTEVFLDDDGVFALFGYVGTPTTRAVIPLVTQARIPFFSVYNGAEASRRPASEYVVNFRAGNSVEPETLVEFLAAQGNRRIAVFYQDNTYGEAMLGRVKTEMDNSDLTVVATGTVEADTRGVEDAVNAIAMSNADAVVIISEERFSSAFVKEMTKTGQRPQFADVANMRSDGTLEGFIAAKAFVEGLRHAGADLTREKFVYALASTRDEDYLRFSTAGEFVTVLVRRDDDYLRFSTEDLFTTAGIGRDDDYLSFSTDGAFVLTPRDRDEDYLRFSTAGDFVTALSINTAAAH